MDDVSMSCTAPGWLGRWCYEETQVSYQLQKQPPHYTWAPDYSHWLNVCLLHTGNRSRRTIKQYSCNSFLGKKKNYYCKSTTIACGGFLKYHLPKTAKVYFSDFVMGSLQSLIFSVTASAHSGGLKRSCALKTTTAGKAENYDSSY